MKLGDILAIKRKMDEEAIPLVDRECNITVDQGKSLLKELNQAWGASYNQKPEDEMTDEEVKKAFAGSYIYGIAMEVVDES